MLEFVIKDNLEVLEVLEMFRIRNCLELTGKYRYVLERKDKCKPHVQEILRPRICRFLGKAPRR